MILFYLITAASIVIFSIFSLRAGDQPKKAQKHHKVIKRYISENHAWSEAIRSIQALDFKEAKKKSDWELSQGTISLTHYNDVLAHCYLWMGELEQAYQASRIALLDEPWSSESYDALGLYYASLGNFTQAFRAFEKDIDGWNVQSYKAMVYCFMGNKNQCVLHYNTFLLMCTQLHFDRFIRYPLAMVLLIDDPKNAYKMSITDINKLGINDKSGQNALLPAIFSLRYLKRPKEADKLIQEFLKIPNRNRLRVNNIIEYINGTITAQKLIEAAMKADVYPQKIYEIEARTWIGVDLDHKGDIIESQKHLKWVIMNQKSVMTTYYVQGIAVPLLQKQNMKLMNQPNMPKL
jgi:tetratricopeptide (TPR) repeat protein